MSLSRQIAYGTIIQFIGKAISLGFGLVAIAMTARYLGPFGFGEYTTVVTFLSFFAIFADLGLTLVTVQLISRPDADEGRIMANLFTLRLATAALLIGLAPIVVILFPYSAAIKTGVLIAAGTFFFTALNQALVGLFQKRLRVDRVAAAEVVRTLALVAGTVAAIRFDAGLPGILAANVLSSAIGFLLHWLFARPLVRIGIAFDRGLWREIISRSWPIAVTIVCNLIYLKADTLLLSLLPRASAIGITAEVGLYGAAYKVVDVLVAFPFIFAGLVLPVLTARWAAGDRAGFAAVLQRSFDAMVAIALPMVAGTWFVGRSVMTVVAGADFAGAGPVLRLLIIAAAAIFIGTVFSHAVIAVDAQRRIIPAYAFTAVSALALYLLLIPAWNYTGAAIGTIYSELFMAVAAAWLIRRRTGFRPAPGFALKAAAATAVMSLCLVALRHWSGSLWLLLAGGVAAYILALLAVGGIRRRDLAGLLARTV